MHGLARDERGAVAAEFVVTIPIFLLVLGLVLGALHLGTQKIALQAAANDIARLEARGDDGRAGARLTELSGEVAITRELSEGIYCVSLSSAPAHGLLSALTLSVKSCAAYSRS